MTLRCHFERFTLFDHTLVAQGWLFCDEATVQQAVSCEGRETRFP